MIVRLGDPPNPGGAAGFGCTPDGVAVSLPRGAAGSRCRRKCPTASEPVKAQDVFGPDTGTLLFDHPFEECRFHLRRTLPTGGDPQRHEAIDAGTTNVVGVENTLVLSLWTI